MIRLKLMDGGTLEIPREEALEFLSYRGVFASPMLKSPLEGLLPYRGKLVPVLGPLPEGDFEMLPPEERPWLLLMKGCAQVVKGFPDFNESAEILPFPGARDDSTALLGEIDELLKSA